MQVGRFAGWIAGGPICRRMVEWQIEGVGSGHVGGLNDGLDRQDGHILRAPACFHAAMRTVEEVM